MNFFHNKHLKIFLIVQIVFTALTCIWVLFVGKSLSWDVWNHHLYSSFGWTSGRIETDLFPAGAQSYQNPLGYLPFYYMVEANWPAWSIGIILAVIHSLNMGMIWIIATALWRENQHVYYWSICALVLTWITPLFLQFSGTSSNDPLSSIFVLAGFSLVFVCRVKLSLAALAAGLLIGIAFSIKQSNAIYGISLVFLLLWQIAQKHNSFKNLFIYFLGGLSGVVIGMGAWSWILWKRFGNPIFPLYNNIFKSAYAPQDPILADRFVPHSVYEWISRIWDLGLVKNFVYTETFSPDIRPLFFSVVLLASFILFIYKKIKIKSGLKEWGGKDSDLLVFFTVSYILWLMTSGNGRYGLPVLLLFGVLLARYVFFLFSVRYARIIIGSVIALQGLVFLVGGEYRMEAWKWDSKPYFNVVVPDKLRETPFLHLAIGVQTYSSIIPFLNKDGAFSNPIGGLSIPVEGVVGDEFRTILNDWHGNVRLLRSSIRNPETGDIDQDLKKSVSEGLSFLLSRLNLAVNLDDCEYIQVIGQYNDFSFYKKQNPDQTMLEFMSCQIVTDESANVRFGKGQEIADQVFAYVEKECPVIYGPSGAVTERSRKGFFRFYANTDSNVLVSLTDNIVLASHLRRSTEILLGSIDDILSGKAEIPCEMWSLRTPD